MALQDPSQQPGVARGGSVPGQGARPLQAKPLTPQLRPMPVPVPPAAPAAVPQQPVLRPAAAPAAAIPLQAVLQPAAQGSLTPRPLTPQPAPRPAPILVPQGTAMPKARAEEEDEEGPPVEEVLKKNAPPWLISLAVQMTIVILLGLWAMPIENKEAYELNASYSDQIGDELADDSFTFESQMPEDSAIAISNLNPVDNPLAAPPQLTPSIDGNTMTSEASAPVAGLALQGRDVGMKEALMKAYGGTGASEKAVQFGLEWLARQQKADGSWSIKGPYPDGAVFSENTAAATAMAMLAFQGNGVTHLKGNHKKTVEKGKQYLLRKIDKDGRFPIEGKKDQTLYTQAQCTIVLCELYAMSRDPDLRDPADRALKFCLESQNMEQGGWRYSPGQDSDTSVTGWMMMALQSARMAGLDVPKANLDAIKRYLDKAAQHSGARYSYQPGGSPDDATMTAEGLLCRQWLGWSREDNRLRRGAEWLLDEENLPSMKFQDVYYWYYGTQMMHHMEGSYWKKWNANMRDMVVKAQSLTGKDKGSWNPTKDKWGAHAGRLYQTCMSIYILETYYRHLPLYAGASASVP